MRASLARPVRRCAQRACACTHGPRGFPLPSVQCPCPSGAPRCAWSCRGAEHQHHGHSWAWSRPRLTRPRARRVRAACAHRACPPSRHSSSPGAAETAPRTSPATSRGAAAAAGRERGCGRAEGGGGRQCAAWPLAATCCAGVRPQSSTPASMGHGMRPWNFRGGPAGGTAFTIVLCCAGAARAHLA